MLTVMCHPSLFLSPCSLVQVRNHIKSSLRDVGKGWFNLKESNREL